MASMWMVRGDAGALYDDFRDKGVATIGWWQFAAHAKPGVSRKQLAELFAKAEPGLKNGTIVAGASQVWRFINEIAVGDHVLTYSPDNRTYLLGTVTGAAEHKPEWNDAGMSLARTVNWNAQEVLRDTLSMPTRNNLGSTLTVFKVPAPAAKEILAGPKAVSPVVAEVAADIDAPEIAIDVKEQSREQIKDMVARLEPREMEQLVAGILRAMGFKTRVSPVGPDRGKDIIASPDGFGFRDPRIVVEVKHRNGQMGSQDLRSFLGGRHPGDRGPLRQHGRLQQGRPVRSQAGAGADDTVDARRPRAGAGRALRPDGCGDEADGAAKACVLACLAASCALRPTFAVK